MGQAMMQGTGQGSAAGGGQGSSGKAVRVIVTRPGREAAPWVADLTARGIRAQALPLIEIAPAPDAQAVRHAWTELGDCAAAMFVSGNAVAQFFAAGRAAMPSSAWPSGGRPRAWATGPGTRQALLDAGVPQRLVDAPGADAAQFDSEALFAIVAPQVRAGDRVLIVRGVDAARSGVAQGAGRDWLASRLREAGCEVRFVAAYERRAPGLDAAQLQLAREAAADGSVWLFSSSEAVAHLRAALPEADFARARALATHPRIADAAREAGFGLVRQTRPKLADVVASIESFA